MEAILSEAKEYIERGKIHALQQLIDDLILAKQDKEYRYNFEYLWQKSYLHACITFKKNRTRDHQEILELLLHCYNMMDDVTKIALKPTLVYGKYL